MYSISFFRVFMNNCLKLWLLFSISKGMVPFTFFRDSAISDLRFLRFYLC